MRRDHAAWLKAQDPARLVFIDESGCNCGMARQYARGPVGERVVDRVPCNYGGPITIIGALTLSGLSSLMTIEGGTDTAVFEVYVEHFLIPELCPGDIVVADNLPAHKGKRVRQLLEQAGCQLVFQPPYSPDMNPIEHAWSKLKAFLRSARARCRDSLDTAIAMGADCISEDDAYGWFRHCGTAAQTF